MKKTYQIKTLDGFYHQLSLKKYLSLKNRIKKNEGFSEKAYLDQLGFLTIGYGHLIKRTEKHLLNKKLSKKHLSNIFEIDFNNALKKFAKYYKKYNFSKIIEETLIEMIFQLGIKKQKKFTKMNNYLKKNSLFMASLEMLDSLWYKQTPRRVDRLIKALLSINYEKKHKKYFS